MRHIKLGQKGLLRIKEVDPPDLTTTQLGSCWSGKDLPPELQSIEGTERVLFLEPLKPIFTKKDIANMNLTAAE